MTGSLIRDACIWDRRVLALFSHSREAKAAAKGGKTGGRPDLITWAPKTDTDSFEYFAADSDLWATSTLQLLQQMCTKAVVALKKLDSSFRPEDLRVFTVSLSNIIAHMASMSELEQAQGIQLPFLLYQNMVQALDQFDVYLVKLVKGSKSSKARDNLEDLRQSLMRAVELVLACADFLGEVKSHTGALSPYSEKQPKVVSRQEDLAGGSDSKARVPYGIHKKKPRTGKKAAAAAADGSTEEGSATTEEDDMLDEMLGEVIDDLGYMHEQTTDILERYDGACNEGIHDPDRIMPLLSVYTKLRQLGEDLKETAKEIGDLRSDDPAGEWWEGGGEYDDQGAELAAPAASSTSSTPASTTSPAAPPEPPK